MDACKNACKKATSGIKAQAEMDKESRSAKGGRRCKIKNINIVAGKTEIKAVGKAVEKMANKNPKVTAQVHHDANL